ncbi:MAG: DUF6448 family protein [Kiritimatiellae bacterium]|nr:DUF6448 family protein [Kiritimatiellia bacterium]MDD5522525.1 DUF6448 family protein [Kiritimatiellia bacterium]
MKPETRIKKVLMAVTVVGVLGVLDVGMVLAHCDTMNGPVIPEAKAALEKGDVTPILKWVKKDNEMEIKAAFTKAVAVRAKGSEAKEIADQYFLETLVRLHRAGEGAPYTGIRDEPVEPIVAMADKALADSSADTMIKRMSGHMEHAIREKFEKVLEARKHKDKSIETGREFVEAYVIYMHYVEGIHAAIMSASSHHVEAGEGIQKHKH